MIKELKWDILIIIGVVLIMLFNLSKNGLHLDIVGYVLALLCEVEIMALKYELKGE